MRAAMLQTILLVIMILISVALTGVVLLQRSEGGALGMGGGPSGFMTARGAGNLLTKTTWVLATLFFVCALGLTIVGNVSRSSQSIATKESVGALLPTEPQSQPTQSAPAQPAEEPQAPAFDLEESLTAPAGAPAQ